MSSTHHNISLERWSQFSLAEQMANIGSEVNRTLIWQEKNRITQANLAFERALELFELTKQAQKSNFTKLKEINRAREVFAEYYAGNNQYNCTAESLKKYFYFFNVLARK